MSRNCFCGSPATTFSINTLNGYRAMSRHTYFCSTNCRKEYIDNFICSKCGANDPVADYYGTKLCIQHAGDIPCYYKNLNDENKCSFCGDEEDIYFDSWFCNMDLDNPEKSYAYPACESCYSKIIGEKGLDTCKLCNKHFKDGENGICDDCNTKLGDIKEHYEVKINNPNEKRLFMALPF